MLMHDDEREIKYYNNDLAQETIAVGKDGVTKIEVYKEHGNFYSKLMDQANS